MSEKVLSYPRKGFLNSHGIESLRQLVWRPFPIRRKKLKEEGVKRLNAERKSLKKQ
ncbi:hypothetical protein [Methanosarcina acetivorans]|uniref:hypothetical protein n=1 Tax=Methanosarcina acetivorans TaxID=2214 RepID=UPI000A673D9F|nr:hypothetical protein [Methanosarcina acetivorans]